uniref:UDP-glucuronate decarboxylase n=1 Tax=Anthurium amnicola TaxID=1678845 RepID=A0A1D1YBJ8_9ARAE
MRLIPPNLASSCSSLFLVSWYVCIRKFGFLCPWDRRVEKAPTYDHVALLLFWFSRILRAYKTNVVGTLNMLGLAKRVGARFLLTSTSEVYGDPLQHPQVETYWGNVNPIGVRSCYDEGKRTAETLTMDYHRGASVEVVQETIDPNAKIEFRPNTEDDPYKRKPDITKAKEKLGWEPTIPLRKGLPLMVSDFRKRIFGDHGTSDTGVRSGSDDISS